MEWEKGSWARACKAEPPASLLACLASGEPVRGGAATAGKENPGTRALAGGHKGSEGREESFPRGAFEGEMRLPLLLWE